MDIRERFKKQQARHQAPEPKPEAKPKPPEWQSELLDKLSDRIEKIIVDHGGVAPVSGQETDETTPNPSQKPRRRISFDDFSSILDALNEENK